MSNGSGHKKTVTGLDRLYIKRSSDGTCSFLCNKANTYFCALQNMKPEACKIWPFKVLSEPKYGQPKQAAFDYGRTRLYIYVDTMCSGLRYGAPSWDFQNVTLKEFIEIALGTRQVQYKSTRSANYQAAWWDNPSGF